MTILINDSTSELAADTLPVQAPANPSAQSSTVVAASRWAGIHRPYTSANVERLRSSVRVHHTLAQVGARRLWELLTTRDYVHALGAMTGNQAVQQVRGGLEAIY